MAQTTPSQPNLLSGRPSTSTTTSSIRWRAAFSTLASLSAQVVSTSSLVAEDAHVERQPLLAGVAALDDRLDHGLDVLALGLGEEADVAEVDAEQRRAGAVGQLGRAQDRAVAADDQRPARTARSAAPLDADRLDAVGGAELELLGLVVEHPDQQAVLHQRVHDLEGDLARLLPARVGQQQDPPRASSSARGVGLGHGFTLSPGTPQDAERATSASIASRSTTGSPARSQTKNSTLPEGPAAGWSSTARVPQPRSAAASTTLADGVGAVRRVADDAAACPAVPCRPRTAA